MRYMKLTLFAQVATAMAAGATTNNAAFTVVLGDNFCVFTWSLLCLVNALKHRVATFADQEGIETDVHDPRFKETFEDVFTGSSLQGPAYQFYILGGVSERTRLCACVLVPLFMPASLYASCLPLQNHDHYGNVTAQIAYTRYSNRWYYPSLYYTFTKTTSDGATIQVQHGLILRPIRVVMKFRCRTRNASFLRLIG